MGQSPDEAARSRCLLRLSQQRDAYVLLGRRRPGVLVDHQPREGRTRAALNFSECTKTGGESDDAAETVRDGSMPPGYYTWLGLHSNARLTAKERQELASGLMRTLRGAGCGGGG